MAEAQPQGERGGRGARAVFHRRGYNGSGRSEGHQPTRRGCPRAPSTNYFSSKGGDGPVEALRAATGAGRGAGRLERNPSLPPLARLRAALRLPRRRTIERVRGRGAAACSANFATEIAGLNPVLARGGGADGFGRWVEAGHRDAWREAGRGRRAFDADRDVDLIARHPGPRLGGPACLHAQGHRRAAGRRSSSPGRVRPRCWGTRTTSSEVAMVGRATIATHEDQGGRPVAGSSSVGGPLRVVARCWRAGLRRRGLPR